MFQVTSHMLLLYTCT